MSLREIITELADSLEAEINARAIGELPRRIARDLDVVRRARALLAEPEAPTFQQRVQPWMLETFGAEIAADSTERRHRFLEEAIELDQACGGTRSEALQLVDYVYGRPVGDPAQEVGGVMVTLAALCLARRINMHAAGECELARVWTCVEKIRAKQAAKPRHSPLPEAPSAERMAEVVDHNGPYPRLRWTEAARTTHLPVGTSLYAHPPQPAATCMPGDERMTWLRELVEGMEVSVDVSTCDGDADHRYFGTVSEAMDNPSSKHGVILLVQDAEPNFERDAAVKRADALAVAHADAVARLDQRSAELVAAEQWERAYRYVTDILPIDDSNAVRDPASPMAMAEQDRHRVDVLIAECEGLRKDADFVKRLLDRVSFCLNDARRNGTTERGTDYALSMIDAAIAEQKAVQS